ncbi:MAG: DUF1761 domain-containing protein [Aeromicrobium sp.]|uniref:DUF1761 domain-containing protein n=1 Tax=Aeromicrobium sp. TaxID=1871063 RepID=UPI003C34C453
MDNYSIVAVLVGGVAFFALGAIWYTALFRKPWAADMGITFAEGEGPQAPPVTTMAVSVLIGFVLAGVIEYFTRDAGAGHGAKAGLAVGIAIAALMGQNALYDSKPPRLWVINAGYPLLGAVVVGVVCGLI